MMADDEIKKDEEGGEVNPDAVDDVLGDEGTWDDEDTEETAEEEEDSY